MREPVPGSVCRGDLRRTEKYAPWVPRSTSKPPLWKDEPDAHDYPAALEYLSLIMSPTEAKASIPRLRRSPLVHHRAKDLLRASGLSTLGPANAHVHGDLLKIKRGERLSPVLLLRGRLGSAMPLTIADGYHRVCAVYHLDEDAIVPCRVAEPPT